MNTSEKGLSLWHRRAQDDCVEENIARRSLISCTDRSEPPKLLARPEIARRAS